MHTLSEQPWNSMAWDEITRVYITFLLDMIEMMLLVIRHNSAKGTSNIMQYWIKHFILRTAHSGLV